MRSQHFEIVVAQSDMPVDLRLLARLLAASAMRQHLERSLVHTNDVPISVTPAVAEHEP